MNATAVIIARFQTPYLHEGHRHLLDTIRSRHHKVVIVLGVSPLKGSRRNPFDFYTRERLLKKDYPDLVVLPLSDHPSDVVWSHNLDRLLQDSFPQEPFILYGSRDSFLPCYHGRLPVEELPQWGSHSATAIRQDCSDQVLDSEDFRLGINYACHNTYPKVYPTVDIALLQAGRQKVLLGKKHNRQEWRLPGGFADPTDSSFEAAARRELAEECGPVEAGVLHYVGSAQIDDWRYRREADKVLTLLFATDLLFGNPRAGDDLERVEWFDVSRLEEMIARGEIAAEHHILIRLLLAHEELKKRTVLQ